MNPVMILITGVYPPVFYFVVDLFEIHFFKEYKYKSMERRGKIFLLAEPLDNLCRNENLSQGFESYFRMTWRFASLSLRDAYIQ